MTTMLFFDDQRLFSRSGLTREYGKPEFIPDSRYLDPNCDLSFAFPNVLKKPEGGYMMFYQAFDKKNISWPFAAESEDGIHWDPRNSAHEIMENPLYPNLLLPSEDAELAKVYLDPVDIPERRYKALTARYLREELSVADEIYTSPDGLHWQLWDKVWSDRHTEPGAGCVYSDVLKSHMVVARSGWGMRQICLYETKDWEQFVPSRECVQIDSVDAPDQETYGMPVFSYKGWYLGLLWMYQVPHMENSTHYFGGKMNCQLCYSLNGAHWQRSLRTPFIGNDLPCSSGLVFPTSVTPMEDGSILITAAASTHEHGLSEAGGSIITYRLREDGFICLTAEQAGSLGTRQLWIHGDLRWNLRAEKATMAVLYNGQPLEGYSHEDCVPFSGDSTGWSPVFRDGKTVADLDGKVVSVELRLKKGSVYSYSGDFEPLMNTEAARVEKFGRREIL